MATYQSLYRRYRSQRFDEVLGQDHVTQALRNAVRDDRVGHAYLFSGPRGTGKTSTARILAKVLNCAAPEDGEPCGTCENCVAVAEGRVVDWLLEQDAASKSKVDDMRDLLDRVPLGTSGNRKVIILDEVHMLSQGAENALLKTLEEPPAHVVFVLATTDPQKVRPTILSRTQHFTFRLLQPDIVAAHVRHVIEDAGLGIAPGEVDQAVDHVVRAGGGSVRDTLSALDQVAALGTVVDEGQPVDAILDALADRDAGRVLVGVAQALAAGRDPRGLGEAIIAGLRDAFLSLMGAADEHLAPDARARAAEVGERFGAPGLTRGLDVLGEALTELSRKPDPRVVVEVALVRLTQPSTDRTLDAVLERLDRLERVAAGGAIGSGGPTSSGAAPVGGTGGDAAAGAAGTTGRRTRRGGGPDAGAGGPAGGGDGPASGASPAGGDAGTAPGTDSASAGGGRTGRGASAARDALSTARQAETTPSGQPSTSRGSGQPTLGALARGRKTGEAPDVAPPVDDPHHADAGGWSPPEATTASSGASEPLSPSAGTASAGTASAGTASAGTASAGTASAATSPSAGPVSSTGPSSAGAGPAGSRSAGSASVRPATGGPSQATTLLPPATQAAGEDAPDAVTPTAGADAPTAAQVDAAWAEVVLGALKVKVRSRWRSGRWADVEGGAWRFAVPNAWHQSACDESRTAVEQALTAHFGRPITVSVVVDDDAPAAVLGPAGGGPGPGAGPADDVDEHIDPRDLRDADDAPGNGVDLVLREFGGGQVVEEGT